MTFMYLEVVRMLFIRCRRINIEFNNLILSLTGKHALTTYILLFRIPEFRVDEESCGELTSLFIVCYPTTNRT